MSYYFYYGSLDNVKTFFLVDSKHALKIYFIYSIKTNGFKFCLFYFIVFDVIETLQDNSHKFANDNENINPTFLKIVTKDIQILKKSLPAGIWVKTFESRMVSNIYNYIFYVIINYAKALYLICNNFNNFKSLLNNNYSFGDYYAYSYFRICFV